MPGQMACRILLRLHLLPKADTNLITAVLVGAMVEVVVEAGDTIGAEVDRSM